jgi:hypothetical protein
MFGTQGRGIRAPFIGGIVTRIGAGEGAIGGIYVSGCGFVDRCKSDSQGSEAFELIRKNRLKLVTHSDQGFHVGRALSKSS